MNSSKSALQKILILNGPNLNLLGKREPEIYGHDTLDEINAFVRKQSAEYGLTLDFQQSNHEGALIDAIQAAADVYDGLVINPAAFTHYSIAIRDAISAVAVPAVEVHLSDLAKRESFRRHSVISEVCVDSIMGFGQAGYLYGIEALLGHAVATEFAGQAAQQADFDAILKLAVDKLAAAFPKFDWTGIYMVDGDELVVDHFVGAPTPHVRIPIGHGICGAAVAEEETIIVPDVNADPRYLACSIETKSEIVVPIYSDGTIIGEIDIDSHRPDAFKPHDQRYLEKMAEVIGGRFGYLKRRKS